ncbi:MAG: ankyrin repeat domain-containing protein [Chthonomonadaceae bacterium]|nr:ankyrin repeat domain-containing protein [Chthonomonadaceae bacterium]
MRLLFLIAMFAVLPVLRLSQTKHSRISTNQQLIIAIKRNDLGTVRALLNKGANPNTHQECLWTKIPRNKLSTEIRSWKRRTGDHPPSALMIALGIWARDDPQYDKSNGFYASNALIKALIKAGANVNEADIEQGDTPLMFAVRRKDTFVAEMLLSSGAHLNAQDKKGLTALAFAVFDPDYDQSKMVEFLLKRGADPNGASTNQGLPLVLVRGPGSLKCVHLMVNYGADINATDAHGKSVLARIKEDQKGFFPASPDVVDLLCKLGSRE